jgi:hypothetical protein
MDGQSTSRIFLAFLVTVAAVRAQGGYFHFDNGLAEDMKGPCGHANGIWTVEEATNYTIVGGKEGPQDGKVIVSQPGKGQISCLKIPGLQSIEKNFTIKVYLFVPDSNNEIKLSANFVALSAPSVRTRQPTEAGWHVIEMSIPEPTKVKPSYPGPYTVRY